MIRAEVQSESLIHAKSLFFPLWLFTASNSISRLTNHIRTFSNQRFKLPHHKTEAFQPRTNSSCTTGVKLEFLKWHVRQLPRPISQWGKSLAGLLRVTPSCFMTNIVQHFHIAAVIVKEGMDVVGMRKKWVKNNLIIPKNKLLILFLLSHNLIETINKKNR